MLFEREQRTRARELLGVLHWAEWGACVIVVAQRDGRMRLARRWWTRDVLRQEGHGELARSLAALRVPPGSVAVLVDEGRGFGRVELLDIAGDARTELGG